MQQRRPMQLSMVSNWRKGLKMKLRDFYRILATDPDLNLDSELFCNLDTCCGTQDSIALEERGIEIDSDYIFLTINAGSCREYGNKASCKNYEILNLILRELEESGSMAILLTSKNEQLRKYIEARFE